MKISHITILCVVLLLITSAYAQSRKPEKQSPSSPTIVRPMERIVAVYFRTDLDGRVDYASVKSGDSAYYDRAVAAAKKLKFSRRRYRGQLISTAGIVVYKFVGERAIIMEMHKGRAVTTD